MSKEAFQELLEIPVDIFEPYSCILTEDYLSNPMLREMFLNILFSNNQHIRYIKSLIKNRISIENESYSIKFLGYYYRIECEYYGNKMELLEYNIFPSHLHIDSFDTFYLRKSNIQIGYNSDQTRKELDNIQFSNDLYCNSEYIRYYFNVYAYLDGKNYCTDAIIWVEKDGLFYELIVETINLYDMKRDRCKSIEFKWKKKPHEELFEFFQDEEAQDIVSEEIEFRRRLDLHKLLYCLNNVSIPSMNIVSVLNNIDPESILEIIEHINSL